MYNSSLYSADRTTHLKIVALSLLASIVVLVVGITGHPASFDTARIEARVPRTAYPDWVLPSPPVSSPRVSSPRVSSPRVSSP
jgi:hypothetical protein